MWRIRQWPRWRTTSYSSVGRAAWAESFVSGVSMPSYCLTSFRDLLRADFRPALFLWRRTYLLSLSVSISSCLPAIRGHLQQRLSNLQERRWSRDTHRPNSDAQGMAPVDLSTWGACQLEVSWKVPAIGVTEPEVLPASISPVCWRLQRSCDPALWPLRSANETQVSRRGRPKQYRSYPVAYASIVSTMRHIPSAELVASYGILGNNENDHSRFPRFLPAQPRSRQ